MSGDRSAGGDPGPEIVRLRAEIDVLDDALRDLLDRRAALALRLGHLKRGAGLPLRDPVREGVVLAHVGRPTGAFPDDDARAVWERIIAACLRVQEEDDPPLATEGEGG